MVSLVRKDKAVNDLLDDVHSAAPEVVAMTLRAIVITLLSCNPSVLGFVRISALMLALRSWRRKHRFPRSAMPSRSVNRMCVF